MESNEVKEVREYTDGDILKAVGKLPEDNQNILLENLTITNVRKLVNSKKDFEECYSNYMFNAYCYKMMADTLKDIFETMDSKLVDEPKDLSSEYDKLSDTDKKRTALEMLNNKDFQKNCCDILVRDFERIVAEDPTYKTLDKFLGVGKFLRKCLENGIGCDHKYMICDEKCS